MSERQFDQAVGEYSHDTSVLAMTNNDGAATDQPFAPCAGDHCPGSPCRESHASARRTKSAAVLRYYRRHGARPGSGKLQQPGDPDRGRDRSAQTKVASCRQPSRVIMTAISAVLKQKRRERGQRKRACAFNQRHHRPSPARRRREIGAASERRRRLTASCRVSCRQIPAREAVTKPAASKARAMRRHTGLR